MQSFKIKKLKKMDPLEYEGHSTKGSIFLCIFKGLLVGSTSNGMSATNCSSFMSLQVDHVCIKLPELENGSHLQS